MNEQQTPQQGGSAIGLPPSGTNSLPPNVANGAQAIYQTPYAPYTKPSRIPYEFRAGDAAYACFTLALGFLVFEWRIGSSLGTFLLITAALVGTLIYLNTRGVKQSFRSIVAYAVCFAAALPFLLYDVVPANILLLLFAACACFYWILVSAGNSAEARISGYVLVDWLNQAFVIPFSNFAGLFVSIKTASKDAKRGKSVLAGVFGVCVAIPVIIGVTSLLINSDQGFEKFALDFSDWLGVDRIGTYILQFIGGIPIALYIFGSVCGNIQKRYTKVITKETTDRGLAFAHRIPRVAILAPVAVLCGLYVVYTAVMSAYFFSAFEGKLPSGFTYAGYARSGFFELCGVAAINLFVLIFSYSFAKRTAGEYPKPLRVLSGLLCVMTELLVVIAVSKMLLYIDAYGLSRLRVYVLWFLILLFIVFAILIIWHIRPYIKRPAGLISFNAGRPIAVISVCFFLALFLANTDGIIAKYNVWQYESGKSQTIDSYMLSNLSDAALPYLASLHENARDESVRDFAGNALARISSDKERGLRSRTGNANDYRDWNIQSAMAAQYLPGGE